MILQFGKAPQMAVDVARLYGKADLGRISPGSIDILPGRVDEKIPNYQTPLACFRIKIPCTPGRRQHLDTQLLFSASLHPVAHQIWLERDIGGVKMGKKKRYTRF